MSKSRRALIKKMYPKQSLEEYKRQIFIEELHNLNVYTTEEGCPIEQLSYDRLKEEMVLVSFRRIDVGNSENVWF